MLNSGTSFQGFVPLAGDPEVPVRPGTPRRTPEPRKRVGEQLTSQYLVEVLLVRDFCDWLRVWC